MKSCPNGPKFCRDSLWGLKPWPTNFESHFFKTVALSNLKNLLSTFVGGFLSTFVGGHQQKWTRHPVLLQQKKFSLKWFRSCSNFVSGISLMKLDEKLHITMGLRCNILTNLLSTFVGGTLEKVSRIVATEIFYLNWLRIGWNMTRTFF